jgi:hypothetical protein
MWHILLKESYAPLQQLTRLELPWLIALEELPVETAGASCAQGDFVGMFDLFVNCVVSSQVT